MAFTPWFSVATVAAGGVVALSMARFGFANVYACCGDSAVDSGPALWLWHWSITAAHAKPAAPTNIELWAAHRIRNIGSSSHPSTWCSEITLPDAPDEGHAFGDSPQCAYRAKECAEVSIGPFVHAPLHRYAFHAPHVAPCGVAPLQGLARRSWKER